MYLCFLLLLLLHAFLVLYEVTYRTNILCCCCCALLCSGFALQFVTACGHEPKVLDFSQVKEAPPDPESVRNASAVKIGESQPPKRRPNVVVYFF